MTLSPDLSKNFTMNLGFMMLAMLLAATRGVRAQTTDVYTAAASSAVTSTAAVSTSDPGNEPTISCYYEMKLVGNCPSYVSSAYSDQLFGKMELECFSVAECSTAGYQLLSGSTCWIYARGCHHAEDFCEADNLNEAIDYYYHTFEDHEQFHGCCDGNFCNDDAFSDSLRSAVPAAPAASSSAVPFIGAMSIIVAVASVIHTF